MVALPQKDVCIRPAQLENYLTCVLKRLLAVCEQDHLQKSVFFCSFTPLYAAQGLLTHPLEEAVFTASYFVYHGPKQPVWRNYGLIVGTEDVHHCHLNSGRPRYVAVWKVVNRAIRIMEIRFVGPHGSANYSRFK